jgi:Protein of unknown function (DUF3102)
MENSNTISQPDSTETAGVFTGGIENDESTGTSRSEIPPARTQLPIAERINSAYSKSLEMAIGAVTLAVEAGNLLLEQRANVKQGEWLPWLAANCPSISERTARKLMTSAEYVLKHGYVAAQTVHQLYLEAGAIKAEDAAPERPPGPRDTIITPLMVTFKRVREFYTEERLGTLQQMAVPHFLSWIDKSMGELAAIKARVVKRFGEAAK